MTMKTKVVDGYNSKNRSVTTIGWKSQKNYLESKVVGGDNGKDGLCGKDKNDILEAPTEVLLVWVPSLRRNQFNIGCMKRFVLSTCQPSGPQRLVMLR